MHASWNKLAQFTGRGYVSACWFFDEQNGFIGFTGLNTGPAIMRTTDGGTSWTGVVCPPIANNNPLAIPHISDIWFRNNNEGWATFYWTDPTSNLWHTTDGGATWNAIPFTGNLSSVRQTRHALIVSQFEGPGLSVSVDGGLTFSTSYNQNMNGIDFVDDLNGAASPYNPSRTSMPYDASWYTSDGGVTWQESNVNFHEETWGIYGIKGTGIFLAYPEGQGLVHNTYRSDDFGHTWSSVSSLSQIPTGEIKGSGADVYFQSGDGSGHGLFRSTDRGVTWLNIGGPDNQSDTRISVLDCGNLIFAFDDSGGVWKFQGTGASVPLALYFKTAAVTAVPGDTISIPLYLSGSATLGSTSILLPFSIDTTVLRPIGFVPAVAGMIAGTISYSDGMFIVPMQSAGLVLSGERMIGTLRCIVYLSDTLATQISLFGASIVSPNNPCLALSLTASSVNVLVSGCGSSTLSTFMRTNKSPLDIKSIIPNPFSYSTTIKVSLINPDFVQVSILNLVGSEVARLFTGSLDAGEHSFIWDAHELPAGMYICSARINNETKDFPLMLIK
ncbi:MAG: T9SS type A sorting domain-containing protein [Bacteroidota bacterium]|nr:T9SS type A sorting domain-containing protein [Bacteroidota bacterium]